MAVHGPVLVSVLVRLRRVVRVVLAVVVVRHGRR